MNDSALSPAIPASPAPFEQINITIQNVARRQWWLWTTCVLVTLLLTVGIASFAFPGLLSEREAFYVSNLNIAVRGLVGLVLIFNIYTIYQQLQIHRIQTHLKQQIGAFDKLQDRTEEVYKIAALDCLTGLYNRQCGELRLAEEISRAKRHSKPLTALMLDLNDLKKVNDTFGHDAGDLMLRHFSERLQKAVRGSDVPIRLGGDEFLVLLPECRLSEVQFVLNRLNGIVGEFENHKIPIEFASGWTDYVPGESPQSFMKRADTALYANKRASKVNREEKASQDAPPTALVANDKIAINNTASTLTPREFQVLKLLALGKSNKEVAGALSLSVRTVETYRANIMSHLNIHSASELVLFAVRNKIIEIRDSEN